MSLNDRYPLAIPLLISLLVHGAAVTLVEMTGDGEDGQPSRKQDLRAEYQAPRRAVEPAAKEAAPEPEQTRNTISLETSDPKYKPYFTVLRDKIASQWEEPARGPSDPEKGSLLMEFSLESDGTLRDASVVRSSGVRGFDFAAAEAVKKAAPFDPFPKKIKDKELTVRALFVYE